MLITLVACYATLHPAMSVGQSVPFLGSGPEGVDDLCFHTYGEFSPSPPSSPSPPQFPVSRPKFQSQGSNPGLETQIPASRPKSQPRGPNPNHETRSQEEKEEKKEKIPHMCKSIGHRPLRPLRPLLCSLPQLQSQGTGTTDH